MADDIRQSQLTPDQCREQARLVRYTAEAVRSALLRHDLLDIASEYNQLAERAEDDSSGREF